MKNNFLSLMGMRLKGRSMNDSEITRKSRGNHPVITRFSRLITSTLLLLFTFAIGNVWGAVIDLTPDAEVTGTNKKWKEVGGGYVSRNGGGFTISTDGLQTGSGNTYVVFDVAAASTIEAKFINTSTTAYSDKTICCGKVSSTQWTAITNAVSDDTQYQLTIASGDKLTDQTISLPGTKSATTSCTFTATAAGKYAVYWTSSINNKVRLYEIEITASCDAGDPGNINKGALSASVLTLQVADDPKTGDEFYWQTSATGTTKNKTGENINFGKTYQVSAAGTYYIRSYNVAGDCWSDAKSFEVKATDLVANYTVIYKDGTTELGSETVEVGHHPTATAITTTKEFYTFAAWQESGVDKALEDVSAADGETVTLTARYTAQYTSGTYEFTGNLTMGSAPNQMTIENNSDGKDYAAGRIDNILVSAQKIGYEATGNYGGWKLKTTNGTLRFLVENACGVRVTLGEANPLRIAYTEGGVAKTADIAKSTTSSVYKADANTLVTLTNITSGNKTVTLKKIEILPLYNATYTDGTGDASGSASNVTEVTLPTPSETTVGGYSFTGWVADKTVYKGETAKTAGSGLDAGGTYTLTANTEFTAQWQLISDFDVKFFQGYGDPDAQIGTTQSISTGGHAVAPADPTRTGFAFLGWSYDGTEAHIVDVAAYGITAATNFTAMWKAVWTVTFDGAGNVEVQDGETVASPDSPTQAGKIFQGWYNGESKYDFSAAVTGNLALESKWAVADPNHFYYTYNDDFHFDGVVYKTPDGKTKDPEAAEASNVALETNPYTLFSGTAGITSIIATNGIYDYKKAAGTKHITAYLKLKADDATSNVVFTIASGYTAVLKLKMNGYSSNATISLKKGDDAVTPSGTQEGTAEGKNYGELTYNLTAGEYKLTTANKTLYISHIDLEATALPTHTVTYKPGDGEGDDVVDNDATEVADVPGAFTAPAGKVFNGWKDELDNDVEVGAIVSADMTLTAQWINHYAVTFNMNGHGDAIDPQDIKEGAKATRPDDPIAIGFDFGGWFTDNGTFEAPFDFNTPITAATPLYAKWTAFDGCTLLVPATSGEALTVGATVDLQTGSTGGSIMVAGLNGEGTIAYNTKGLSFSNGGKDSVRVTLNNELKNGSVIKLRIMANGATHNKGRGLNLYNAANAKKALLGWQADEEVATGDVDEFTYTVEEGDGFAGTNIFILQRQNSVFLQSIKVTNCGAAIVYHNLTSAVNIAGKGTVTLGATSVREGYTTTATYSEIDPLYEFVNWTVSGAGASVADATANPATITVGTEDAVVTLNLRLIPVKFTVEYYDGATLMGSEQVAVNENPTASEIVTAKRHYTFLGWSETDGGNVVALNTITRTEAGTVKLYAKYEAVVCPTSGTIFSMEFDETKKPGETVTIAKDASIDLAEYATISGGNAMIINGETSGKDAISTDGEFLLKATKEVMKIELNCVLQEGDIIRIPDNSAKLVISTSNAKTGTYQAFADKNTHEFAVTAAWAGVDDIYVLYDGSSLKFTKVYVIRPAKYDVSFNMMGHGSAIADLEDVVEGSKIVAPSPAPTDVDYSFAGWYKENTLENEWDFDVDVVEANTTLYAKWLDKSDATLKSLKYGSTEIELQAGVYEYNVELPSLTTSVPALTAETSNPNASAVITDDDAFDGEGNASSTVEVTPEKEGAAHQTYTVNFTKLPSMPLLDVENSIVWNFANAGTQNNTFTDEVLANFPGVTNDATFSAQTLKASGAKIKDGYLQGTPILFHATKAGLLRVEFANTGGSARPYRYLVVNGVRTAYKSNNTTHVTTAWIEVPAGDVTIEGECVEDANGACTSDNLNFYKIEFLAVGHERTLVVGDLGTVCLPNASIARGVTVYEYQGADEIGKIAFDELGANELLVAGKPYIFQVNETNARFFYTTDAAAGSPDNSKALKGNLGAAITFQPGSAAAEHVYFVKDHAFWMAKNTGVKIGQYRAYLQMDEVQPVSSPNPAPGRRRIALGVQGENSATGVGEVQGDEVQSTKVIIDGHLYILRGEKMYDAKGQLVK